MNCSFPGDKASRDLVVWRSPTTAIVYALPLTLPVESICDASSVSNLPVRFILRCHCADRAGESGGRADRRRL